MLDSSGVHSFARVHACIRLVAQLQMSLTELTDGRYAPVQSVWRAFAVQTWVPALARLLDTWVCGTVQVSGTRTYKQMST
jgi:hypothetical protein